MRRRRLRSIVAVALAACACAASVPGARAASLADLAVEDRDALALALEARRLVSRVGGEIWPGFERAAIPLVVYRDADIALLVGHPNPPPGYEPLEGMPPGSAAVAVFRGEDPQLIASTALTMGGVATALFRLAPRGAGAAADRGTAPGHPPAEEAIGGMVHEMFHAFAAGQPRPPHAAPAGRYPDSPEALALANLEGRILARTLAAPAEELRDEAKRLLAVRRARRALLGDGLADSEAADEREEGLATYTELEALRLGAKTAGAAAGPAGEVAAFGAYRQWQWLRQAKLADLLGLLDDPGQIRTRGYLSGVAIGLLLDRLDRGWRARALGAEAGLEAALAKACGFNGVEAAERRRQAESRNGYEVLLAQARRDYEMIARRREAVLQTFAGRPGFLVRVMVPPGAVTRYLYDPQNQADPGGARILHLRYLEVEFPGGAFRARGAPALTAYGDSPPDVREVQFVAGEQAAWRVDGSIFYPRQGSLNVLESLRVEEGGVILEGGPAHLYMSGREVEVVFTPSPAGSAPGTPGSP